MRFIHTLILVAIAFIAGVIVGALGVLSLFDVGSSTQASQVATLDNYEYVGTVTRIIDGDTIEVDGIRVRLVGIDTPERGEPGFKEATEFTASLCSVGSTAGLDIDDLEPKDKYGRTLAVVYCNGVNVNAELLRQGYAEVLYIPPSEFDPYSWL
jgi:micrococcal nuclease